MKRSTPEAYQLIHRGQLAHAEIERAGVRVNLDFVRKSRQDIQKRVADLNKKMKSDKVYKLWNRTYGGRMNLGSSDQLGDIIFNKLGYESKDKTATGKPKTDKSALAMVDLDFVRDLQKVGQLEKTVSTYLNGIERFATQRGKHWYIHPNYNLNRASTYRPTCNDPNFQNVPKRDEDMSKFVRTCYMAHPGHHMVEFDFSTLEVRIAYTYHEDPTMRKYLLDPTTDMHRDTAADIFMLPVKLLIEHAKEAKKTIRDCAKNMFVFPEFYGGVYFQQARPIWEAMHIKKWKVPGSDKLMVDHFRKKGITACGDCVPGQDPVKGTLEYHLKEIERIMWEKRLTVYNQWRKDWYRSYLDRGWFQMHTGFVIHTLHSRNDVINYPVQGAAFHCLLWCLIEIMDWLKKKRMRSKIIGEIHDCGVASVHPAELQDFLWKVKDVMTKRLPDAWKWINIPLEIECEVAPIGATWADEEQWKADGEGNWTSIKSLAV